MPCARALITPSSLSVSGGASRKLPELPLSKALSIFWG
jgi:hypothetical protein